MSVYTQSGMCTHANDSPENIFPYENIQRKYTY